MTAPAVPHSPETETTVLSAWSLNEHFGRAWRPEPELFYVPANRLVAKAASKLGPDSRDQASLIAQLDADGQLDKVGGSGGVFRIIQGAPAYGDPWPHLQRLREYAAMRRMIDALVVAIQQARDEKNLHQLVSQLQEIIRLGAADTGTKALSVADLFTVLAERMISQRPVDFCSTGLPTLDHHIGGFQYGQVTIFGAATNWGKSMFLTMVADVQFQTAKRPLLVSAEDIEELYGRRLMQRRARVPASALRSNTLEVDSPEWNRVLEQAERAERLPFFINAIGKNVEGVASDIRSMCASEGIDLVMVDYLQAMRTGKESQDRRNEINHIARELTDAIKQSRASGIIVSQFKRPARPGDKPTKHDLKESGDLENAAENVLLGYLDSAGTHVIEPDKVKDGIKNMQYGLAWDEVACCFLGEIAGYVDPDVEAARVAAAAAEQRRAQRPRWSPR